MENVLGLPDEDVGPGFEPLDRCKMYLGTWTSVRFALERGEKMQNVLGHLDEDVGLS